MIKKALLFFALALLFSCNNNSQNSESESTSKPERDISTLPGSSGSHAELLLIMDDNLFESAAGDLFLKHFAAEQYGLPRPESVFKVVQVESREANYLLKRNKSIVILKLDPETTYTQLNNEWAKPQLITIATAPTVKELTALLKKHIKEMVQQYRNHDLNLLEKAVERSSYSAVPKVLKDLGVEKITLPRGFKNTVDKPDLKIFYNRGIKTDQYLTFYKRAGGGDMASGQDIINVRDSIGKHFFEGGRADSYITTEMKFPPTQEIIDLDGTFVVETRGLWRTEGDLMGGPFLSYSFFNDLTNEVFTVEGMIYGPDADKRNVLLELESIMKSVRLK